MEDKNIEDKISNTDLLDTGFSDINEENDTPEQPGSTGNQNYDSPSKKVRYASGNFVKSNSILPKKKIRNVTYGTNGNQIKNRTILPPRKATNVTGGNFIKTKYFENIGKSKDSNTHNYSNNKFSLGSKSDGNNKSKGKATFKKIWKKLPLKVKLIIIGICVAFIFIVIFIVILLSPFIELGIIDIEGIGSIGNSGSGMVGNQFVSISDSTSYWWPVESDNTRITSPYGYRKDPKTGETKHHKGIDIVTGDGPGVVNIIASNGGTVTKVHTGCPTTKSIKDADTSDEECGGRYGNHIMIKHNDENVTVYAHLYSVYVSEGDTVNQGQTIGKMGSSGKSTGTHLHFEVRESNNGKVDPINYVSIENPRPVVEKPNYVVGNSNKQSVCLALTTTNLPTNAIAAIMTNMEHESSFNPTNVGDNGTSYGLCQWHNNRYDNLVKAYPNNYQTIDSQIKFLMYELENSYVNVYNSLFDNNKSHADLTYNFCTKFEIPADTKKTCENRMKSSEKYYNYVQNGCQ